MSTSLLPKEHGAYAQLALPLVTALAAGKPTLAAAAWTVAFVAAFLAHEPLLVALNMRGTRAAREDGARARRMLLVFAALGVPGAIAAWTWSSWTARVASGVPVVLALAVAVAIVTRRERTLAGEVLVAVALSATSLPVALASGAALRDAVAIAVVWAVGFTAATVSVRGLSLRARMESAHRWVVRAAVPAVLLAGSAGAVGLGLLPLAAPLALTPICVASVVVAIARPHPRRLRAVGWAIAATSTSAAAVLVALLR